MKTSHVSAIVLAILACANEDLAIWRTAFTFLAVLTLCLRDRVEEP